MAVLWLGVVWLFSCWGYALLQLDLNKNLSDGIADAMPLILLGGIGFATTMRLPTRRDLGRASDLPLRISLHELVPLGLVAGAHPAAGHGIVW